MAEDVLFERRGSVALLILNLPEKRNPLSKPLRVALTNALKGILVDDAVRSVVLTGADPAFCSGMDLAEMSALQKKSLAAHKADAQDLLKLFEYVRYFPKPIVAAVNGPAVAGGCGLALLADLIVASPNAFFAFSEVRIGFVPALVGVYATALWGSALTHEMLLTGRSVSAEEAWDGGLLNELAPDHEQLLPHALEHAKRFAKCSPVALKTTKQLLAKTANLESALRKAVLVNSRARTTPDCREGVASFLEKRTAKWVIKE